MEIPILRELIVIFGLAVVVVFVCHRLGIPTVVGLLLTGVLAGPHGLGLIGAAHEVEVMAEIGVVLLLFTIGIEFSLETLLKIKTIAVLGGSLQVAATVAAGTAVSAVTGRPLSQGVFFGFLLALSSTAIVLKILQERAEVDSPHGRTVVGMLIFQDIVVVPMMLLTPLLVGGGERPWLDLGILLVKGAAVILLALFLARWLVPRLLFQAARLRDRELFILAVIFIGLAVAWLTSAAGLSLALGAFLAGLIISESEYSLKALGDILPFRDIFTSLFFVSIGMLLDIRFFLTHPLAIMLLGLAVVMVKSVLAGSSTLALGMPLRTAMLAGLAISQVGEFSFILSRVGIENSLMSAGEYQLFLGVSILTMISTPFIIFSGPRAADLILVMPLPERLKRGYLPSEPGGREAELADHLVIVGFGPGGRNLARAASLSSIPYIVIELNPETVRRERAEGQPIFFGDATQQAALEHAGIKRARILVVAIPDPVATRRVIEICRRLNSGLHIIARTPFITEMEPLYELGANDVIPAEFETSVEIFTRVLAKYLVPREEIEKFILEVRAAGYEMFRSVSGGQAEVCDLRYHIPDLEISALRVHGSSPVAGKTLAGLELRSAYGVTLLAIRRSGRMITNPGASQDLLEGDVAVILGRPEDLARAAALFQDQAG